MQKAKQRKNLRYIHLRKQMHGQLKNIKNWVETGERDNDKIKIPDIRGLE